MPPLWLRCVLLWARAIDILISAAELLAELIHLLFGVVNQFATITGSLVVSSILARPFLSVLWQNAREWMATCMLMPMPSVPKTCADFASVYGEKIRSAFNQSVNWCKHHTTVLYEQLWKPAQQQGDSPPLASMCRTLAPADMQFPLIDIVLLLWKHQVFRLLFYFGRAYLVPALAIMLPLMTLLPVFVPRVGLFQEIWEVSPIHRRFIHFHHVFVELMDGNSAPWKQLTLLQQIAFGLVVIYQWWVSIVLLCALVAVEWSLQKLDIQVCYSWAVRRLTRAALANFGGCLVESSRFYFMAGTLCARSTNIVSTAAGTSCNSSNNNINNNNNNTETSGLLLYSVHTVYYQTESTEFDKLKELFQTFFPTKTEEHTFQGGGGETYSNLQLKLLRNCRHHPFETVALLASRPFSPKEYTELCEHLSKFKSLRLVYGMVSTFDVPGESLRHGLGRIHNRIVSNDNEASAEIRTLRQALETEQRTENEEIVADLGLLQKCKARFINGFQQLINREPSVSAPVEYFLPAAVVDSVLLPYAYKNHFVDWSGGNQEQESREQQKEEEQEQEEEQSTVTSVAVLPDKQEIDNDAWGTNVKARSLMSSTVTCFALHSPTLPVFKAFHQWKSFLSLLMPANAFDTLLALSGDDNYFLASTWLDAFKLLGYFVAQDTQSERSIWQRICKMPHEYYPVGCAHLHQKLDDQLTFPYSIQSLELYVMQSLDTESATLALLPVAREPAASGIETNGGDDSKESLDLSSSRSRSRSSSSSRSRSRSSSRTRSSRSSTSNSRSRSSSSSSTSTNGSRRRTGSSGSILEARICNNNNEVQAIEVCNINATNNTNNTSTFTNLPSYLQAIPSTLIDFATANNTERKSFFELHEEVPTINLTENDDKTNADRSTECKSNAPVEIPSTVVPAPNCDTCHPYTYTPASTLTRILAWKAIG
jgi:hypothetical protein